MQTLFISDLHLSPENPALTHLATDFVLQHKHYQSVYILGDIFHTWLGDDLVLPEYMPFVNALKQLTAQGTKLYLMVGNRDFMLGQRFAEQVGGELITDPVVHFLADQRVLIMHGDSLCTDDVSYQRYRKVVRNRFLQWCFLRLPLRFRQAISDQIKTKSQQKKQYKTAQIMDVNSAEVARLMDLYRCNILIHGHTHRPAIHALKNDKQRIVLGDWQQKPSFLSFDGQKFELVDDRLANAGHCLLAL